MIKIDLHIHSKASGYKEPSGYVDDSDLNHVDVLLSKLKENHIDLFSITDHNRFDSNLYQAFDAKLKESGFDYPKNILAGVEFDVRLDDEMRACHIIAIFDAKNSPENYKKIESAINSYLRDGKDDFYDRATFEQVLKTIGLPVILIAHQKSDLNRTDDKHRSLSASTAHPKDLIRGGYISALEFSRANQEGILKSNLIDMPALTPLVTGSDCHQWRYYPAKDAKNVSQKRFTKLDVLPTFKGLHIAITSPETRIEPKEHKCEFPLTEFSENGNSHRLRNGLIAIIGENGSGKSTFLELLASEKPAAYQSTIRKNNFLSVKPKGNSSKFQVLKQGEIVERFNKDKLFPSDFFQEVNTEQFEEAYNTYASNLKKTIESHIQFQDACSSLNTKQMKLGNFPGVGTFFVMVKIPTSFSNVQNEHREKLDKIMKVIRYIENLIKDPYYDKYKDKLATTLSVFKDIEQDVQTIHIAVSNESAVKNIIESQVREYEDKTSNLKTSEDQDKEKYISNVEDIVEAVVRAIECKAKIKRMPERPAVVSGCSENRMRGFNFTKQADFHDRDVFSEFLIRVFNQNYQSEEALEAIDTKEEFVKAITNCTDADTIDYHFNKNTSDFIEAKKECKGFIIDASRESKSIGNTLGEMSLAYLRYFIQNDDEHPIVFIDQPEDHISNQHISKELITYFNRIRYEKQVFIVTHNPLLVVNLDVDQVIFLRKTNNRIEFVSGPLEMEEANGNMLDIIASNMDGGKEAVLKRMQIYG